MFVTYNIGNLIPLLNPVMDYDALKVLELIIRNDSATSAIIVHSLIGARYAACNNDDYKTAIDLGFIYTELIENAYSDFPIEKQTYCDKILEMLDNLYMNLSVGDDDIPYYKMRDVIEYSRRENNLSCFLRHINPFYDNLDKIPSVLGGRVNCGEQSVLYAFSSIEKGVTIYDSDEVNLEVKYNDEIYTCLYKGEFVGHLILLVIIKCEMLLEYDDDYNILMITFSNRDTIQPVGNFYYGMLIDACESLYPTYLTCEKSIEPPN